MKVVDLTSEEGEAPLKKKLKQAQLPFQTVSPKSRPYDNKKRKLSDASIAEESVIAKQSRIEPNLNTSESEIILVKPDIIITENSNANDITTQISNIDDKVNNVTDKSVLSNVENESEKVLQPGDDDTICTATDDVIKSHETDNLEAEGNEDVEMSLVDTTLKNCEHEKSHESSSMIKSYDEDRSDDAPLLLISDSDDENSEKHSSLESDDEMNSTNADDKIQSPSAKPDESDSSVSTPTSAHSVAKKLTPKQIKQRVESAKKQEERKVQKLEREKKKLQEKEERQKQKKEKEEQKRKEREEKEEQKRKEREEKEKKRQQELDLKNEEKKRKEEDKRKKEEEKRKREEQREEERVKREQEKELQEQKKKKASEAFKSYFSKKTEACQGDGDSNKEQQPELNFMPFAVKSDMRMAPLSRCSLEDGLKKDLDESLALQNTPRDLLYFHQLKTGKTVGFSSRTWPIEDIKSDDDVILLEDVDMFSNVVETTPVSNKMKVKLLQFFENRRPPYWGTWRKKSSNVKPRRPFGHDKVVFDYDVDSDDEWEEEEPGESLHGSDDEQDKEPEDDYEIDNELFVPHGYLSDEEERNEEEEEEDLLLTPETQKARLLNLGLEFEAEMKQKTERLKPRLIGCVWENMDGEKPVVVSDSVWQFLSKYRAMFHDNKPLTFTDENLDPLAPPSMDDTMTQKRFICLPEKYIPDFIKLIHGNSNGRVFLTKEFQAYLLKIDTSLTVSKRNINKYLQDLASWKACPDEGPMYNKVCWYVDKAVREKYNSDASVPNMWNYILTPKRKSVSFLSDSTSENTDEISTNKKTEFSIKKFTKVLSEEDRKQQFATVNVVNSNQQLKKPIVKKRVQLTTLSNFVSVKPEAKSIQNEKIDIIKSVGNISEKIENPKDVSIENSLGKIESSIVKTNDSTVKVDSNTHQEKITTPLEIKKKRVPFITLSRIDTAPSNPLRSDLLSNFITKMEEKDKKIKEINEKEFGIVSSPLNTDTDCVILSD